MRLKNLAGKKFGRWTVIGYGGHDKSNNIMWQCRCNCGASRLVQSGALHNGSSKHCGCSSEVRDTSLEKNPHWKGGRRIDTNGYVMIYMPDHERASYGYVREHLLIFEKILGNPVPDSVIPHHYGQTHDNTRMIMCQDQNYHMLIHARTRAYYQSGHASYKKCPYCKEYDAPKNMYNRKNLYQAWHRKCRTEHERMKRIAA